MAQRYVVVQAPFGADLPTVQLVLANAVPQLIIAAWREVASEHVNTGDYLSRLSLREALRYPFLGDPYSVAVVNHSSYADILEHGHRGFHLPSRWQGWWERSTKTGRRYVRVPFVHTSPMDATGRGGTSTGRRRTMMPRSIYAMARELGSAERLPRELSYGQLSRPYDLLRGIDAPAFAPELTARSYTWAVGRYAGMFVGQMQQTERAPRHAKYLTIRTMTADSPGWYIPPMPPHRFAERALDRAMASIRQMVEVAAAEDMTRLLAVAMSPLVE